jgi:hypothetical protein
LATGISVRQEAAVARGEWGGPGGPPRLSAVASSPWSEHSRAALAPELGLSRKQLHTLRRRIHANLNDTAPTSVRAGTAVEADELYQNAGEKKHAASRCQRSAIPACQ